jgi:hypothetical protein
LTIENQQLSIMKVKPIFCAGCAAFLLFALAGPARAENARLPYHQLYYAQKAGADLNRAHTNLLVVLTLQSTLPNVKTSDLAAYIEARAGKIPIAIGAAGDFTLPMRDDLLAEDPWIIINQPKGTMKLNGQIGVIPGRITRSVHYARLMRPVRDSEEVQEQMRPFFPGSTRLAMTGLKLTFPAAQKRAVAVIHARGGDRKLEADERGEIILPLAPDLLEEDPEISLSDIPGTVEIVSRQSRE